MKKSHIMANEYMNSGGEKWSLEEIKHQEKIEKLETIKNPWLRKIALALEGARARNKSGI